MTLRQILWTTASILMAQHAPLRCFADVTVLWKETFEQDDFWTRWHSDGGLWAVGTPSIGPLTAFAGSRCAATLLDANYLPGSDTRLIRNRIFVVPAASASPRLRFWHWFKGEPGTQRSVELNTGGGGWQTLPAVSGWTDADWTRATFDLSPYAGQAVQLAFHFQSDSDPNTGPGWFIDDVSVESGEAIVPLVNSPQTFEHGLDDWTTDAPGWSWGPPRAVAGTRSGSTNDVGTSPSPAGSNARLVSPVFEVPPGSVNPQLRFWHWFSLTATDLAVVEVAVNGNPWQVLSTPYSSSSAIWSRPSLDLRPFAGQDVQVAFHFKSAGNLLPGIGWDIDDVIVQTSGTQWDPVTQPEHFDTGLGNWSVDNGIWQAGQPPTGPGRTWSGTLCAGTSLTTTKNGTDSRLISPEFTVTPTSLTPTLVFEHWYDLPDAAVAVVELRVGAGAWQQLMPPLTGASDAWVQGQRDLSAYVGLPVQIAFHLQSATGSSSAAGWFVDQVQIVLQSVSPPRLSAGRIDAGVFELCPDNLQPGLTYILEACDGLDQLSDPGHWTQVGILDDGSCQTFYSDVSASQFYRVRSVAQ